MSNLVVVRDEVDGWDVIREDDPQALTNTPTKQAAIEDARADLTRGRRREIVVHEREVLAFVGRGAAVEPMVIGDARLW